MINKTNTIIILIMIIISLLFIYTCYNTDDNKYIDINNSGAYIDNNNYIYKTNIIDISIICIEGYVFYKLSSINIISITNKLNDDGKPVKCE